MPITRNERDGRCYYRFSEAILGWHLARFLRVWQHARGRPMLLVADRWPEAVIPMTYEQDLAVVAEYPDHETMKEILWEY